MWAMPVWQVTLVSRAILLGLLRSSGWCWRCWRWWSWHGYWGSPEFWRCQEQLRHTPVGSWGGSLWLHALSRHCGEYRNDIPIHLPFSCATHYSLAVPSSILLLPSASCTPLCPSCFSCLSSQPQYQCLPWLLACFLLLLCFQILWKLQLTLETSQFHQ